MQNCATCKFFALRRAFDDTGECRIKPPTGFVVQTKFGIQFQGAWPPVLPGHCCGDGQPRLEAIPVHCDTSAPNNGERPSVLV